MADAAVAFQALSVDLAKQRNFVETLFEAFDADNSGLIDSDEFTNAVKSMQGKATGVDQRLAVTFARLDKDRDGSMHAEELKAMLQASAKGKLDVSEADLKEMVSACFCVAPHLCPEGCLCGP